jgi:cytochrome c-type biogenesis protein CcmF
MRGIPAVASFTFCAFVTACIGIEFVRGARARVRMYGESALPALFRLVESNHRRYGGYIVHVAMVLIFAGVTGSSAFQREVTEVVELDGTFQVGPYEASFRRLELGSDARAESVKAEVLISRDGEPVATLGPAREIFPSFRNQPATEVDIHHTLGGDLYLVLLNATPDGQATFKAYINPLVSWIWIGGLVFLLGGLLTMLPDARERRRAQHPSQEPARAAA